MSELKIGDHRYAIEKIAPRPQFHLLRRVSPLLASMGPALIALLDSELPREQVMQIVLQSIGPATEKLSSMDDETVDYILDVCLTHTKRYDAGSQTWHPVYVEQQRGAVRMYADLDGAGELKICSEFIKVNLSGFFGQLSGEAGLPLSSSDAPGT